MFDHQKYNQQYTSAFKQTRQANNQAENLYGVRIVPAADVAEGEYYWKVIGVHHLLPLENMSKHNMYLEALDENGTRITNPPIWAGWTWDGRQEHERADPLPLDKPTNESAGNIAVHYGQTVSMWIKGASRDAAEKSDRVENLHTRHPDEPLPDGQKLNTLGHHSFYIVFQRVKKEAAATATPQPEKTPQATPQPVPAPTPPTAATPKDSAISGRVTNGAGKIIQLLHGDDVDRREIPESGYYRFSPLEAGTYTVMVGNFVQDVQLNGTNKYVANFNLADAQPATEIPAPAPQPIITKPIAHYLLLGPDNTQSNLVSATSYILRFKPTVGFSVNEAKQAQRVTIIGSGITSAEQTLLNALVAQLELLTDDAYNIEAVLNERVSRGQA